MCLALFIIKAGIVDPDGDAIKFGDKICPNVKLWSSFKDEMIKVFWRK